MYRSLHSERIIETAERLAAQVEGRFPGSGLGRVAAEATEVSRRAHERCAEIRRGSLPLRIAIAVVVGLGLAAFGLLFTHVRMTESFWDAENFVQVVNNALGTVVFLGAAVAFLVSLENRWKRGRALEAVGELRALAHVVDMHQLTKDSYAAHGADRAAPRPGGRPMSPADLSNYFEFCSEILSVIGKVGALYVQALPDPVALGAVDELEDLCLGVSHKIWQKIQLVERPSRGREREASEDDGA